MVNFGKLVKILACSALFIVPTISASTAAETATDTQSIAEKQKDKRQESESPLDKYQASLDEYQALKEGSLLGYKAGLFFSRFQKEFKEEVEEKRDNPFNYFPSFSVIDRYYYSTAILEEKLEVDLTKEEEEGRLKLLPSCTEDALEDTIKYYPSLVRVEKFASKVQLPSIRINLHGGEDKEKSKNPSETPKKKGDAALKSIIEEETPREEKQQLKGRVGSIWNLNRPTKRYVTGGATYKMQLLEMDSLKDDYSTLDPQVFVKSENILVDQSMLKYSVKDNNFKYEIRDQLSPKLFLKVETSSTSLIEKKLEGFGVKETKLKLFYANPKGGIWHFQASYNFEKEAYAFAVNYSILF